MASNQGIEKLAKLVTENVDDVWAGEQDQNPLEHLESYGVSLALTQLSEQVYGMLHETDNPQLRELVEKYGEALQAAAVALEPLEQAYVRVFVDDKR